eukprot:23752-Rhodomonas_salina.4
MHDDEQGQISADGVRSGGVQLAPYPKANSPSENLQGHFWASSGHGSERRSWGVAACNSMHPAAADLNASGV